MYHNIKISEFTIKGLHGIPQKTFNFTLENNRLILLGENGSGKTTVLKIFNGIITGQWKSLMSMNFLSCSITINGKVYSFDKSMAVNTLKDGKRSGRLPRSLSRQISQLLEDSNEITPDKISRISDQIGIPEELIWHEIDDIVSLKKTNNPLNSLENLKRDNSIHAIYLPTFRRIEQDLATILGDDSSESRLQHRRRMMRSRKEQHIELVEFGMDDVREIIDRELSVINRVALESFRKMSMATLGDIVDNSYSSFELMPIHQISTDQIENVLDRVNDSYFDQTRKNALISKIEEIKSQQTLSPSAEFVVYYVNKLLEYQQELERRESRIRTLCQICNKYIESKKFVYDPKEFSFKIHLKERKGTVELSDLSSGEKQIVSLFSHLYLDPRRNHFVIIDEPELSLSVPWQRMFLEDISNGSSCVGILAATHSPYIFENSLLKYTKSFGSFLDF